jgi:gamma-glutamyltranspeptidase/glutathione hydrolase
MFNILSRYDLAEYGKGSSRYIHLLASTMKLAYADRALYLGDADYHPVPVDRLISMEHADQQAARIRPDGQPKIDISLDAPPDDAGTTQISVMDRFGNAISLTQTINSVFGSMITVPGTGIVLNNEMDDFSVGSEIPNIWEAVGSVANAVEPGKRPLSSMSPTIVLKDGKPYLVVGSPMGTTIISSVFQTLVNVIDFGFDPQRAVHAPRFHHQWQPDSLWLEPEFPVDVREKLAERGYSFRDRAFMGAVQLIMYDPEQCYYWGGADGRRASGAAGANIGEQHSEEMAERCRLATASGESVVP